MQASSLFAEATFSLPRMRKKDSKCPRAFISEASNQFHRNPTMLNCQIRFHPLSFFFPSYRFKPKLVQMESNNKTQEEKKKKKKKKNTFRHRGCIYASIDIVRGRTLYVPLRRYSVYIYASICTHYIYTYIYIASNLF